MPKGIRFSLYFLMAPVLGAFLFFYSAHVPLPCKATPYRFYSTDKGDDLKKVLQKALKQSQQSITLRTYALTDLGILSLLKQKAQNGIPVHLYYHKKTTPRLHLLEEDNFYFHPIDKRGLMHEKIWIIDERLVFLGSTNLTSSSLKMHDNSMVGLDCPELAKALLQGRVSKITAEVGTKEISYFSLPSQEGLEAVLQAIEGAQKELCLALFTFTHPTLIGKALEAHRRGVRVSLTLDGLTARGASRKAKEIFEKEGIPVKIIQKKRLFHHKWAKIDNKTFIIGSANWTRAAFEKNIDCIAIINIK